LASAPTSARVLIQRPDSFFIDGEWVKPSTDSKIKVVNPSTEEPFLWVAEAQEADIDRAVLAARSAFDHGSWPRLSHAERAEYLRAFARKLEERSELLSGVWTSEIGVVRQLADGVASGAAHAFNYYAALATTFAWQEEHQPLHSPGATKGYLVREPVGVVGAIIPWNGALGLIGWKVAPALLAGCTVVLKSSPESPGSALVVAEIAAEIGLPKGVLNVVTADRDASEALVRNPHVDKITFTGSTAAGKRIGSICGGRIARCTLELGGKSAGVIMDDYDVESAAKSISSTARILNGQVCSSLTRILVSRHRHDAFVDALSAEFDKIRVGDPFDINTELGPLAMQRQRDRVEDYIAKGKVEGAKLAAGGGRPAHLNRGYFVEPTVFAAVDNNMAIAREEIFGPVISVIPTDSEAEAIDIANDSPFGLNASVFTNDAQRAFDVARQLRSGTVGHNAWRTDFSIAFGGFKQSGIGREGGVEGLLPFLESKTVILS